MNIPGFTAEATISTAPKHWSSATVGSHETAETVVASNYFPCFIWQNRAEQYWDIFVRSNYTSNEMYCLAWAYREQYGICLRDQSIVNQARYYKAFNNCPT